MLNGWIEIQLVNGQRFKYVRDVISGDTDLDPTAILDASYYSYGDTTGDTYLFQGDSRKIKGAFDHIYDSYTSGDSLLNFPESIGDTYILIDKNLDEPLEPAPQNAGGDTEIQSIVAYRRTILPVVSVASIAVVERYEPQDNVYVR